MGNSTHHIHLDSCPSTQLFLKERLLELRNQGVNILVSTANQTQGLGRGKNVWDHYSNSLAFSFTLCPAEILTLTSLELGIHLVQFFQNEYKVNLKLKWPNDLLDQAGNKCGGILCHNNGDGFIIAGIGINLGNSGDLPSKYKTPIGQILPEHNFEENASKEIPLKIYQHILESRYSISQIKKQWESFCIHQNCVVRIEDNQNVINGKFKGIGDQGEALVEQNGETRSLVSGSLFLV